MGTIQQSSRNFFFLALLLSFLVPVSFLASVSVAQIVPTNDPPVYGPYNGVSGQGGDGVPEKDGGADTVLRADSPWTMYAWVQSGQPITAPVLVAGYGDVAAEYSRYYRV